MERHRCESLLIKKLIRDPLGLKKLPPEYRFLIVRDRVVAIWKCTGTVDNQGPYYYVYLNFSIPYTYRKDIPTWQQVSWK
jgi:hypothetical protein